MSHRYQAHIDAAFDKVKEVVQQKKDGSDATWRQVVTPTESVNALTVFQRDVPNHPTGILRGEGVFTGFDSNQWMSVVRNPDMRKKWDKMYDSGRTVEALTPETYLAYTLMKGMFPASARDLAVVLRYGTLEDGSKYFLATSVIDSAIPENYGKVRAHADFAFWTFRDLPGDSVSTEVTYTAQTNPAGTIPGFLLKMVSTEIPMCIQNVYSQLKSGAGAPVAVNLYDIEGSGEVMSALTTDTTYDNDSKVFKAQLSFQGAANALIASFIVDPAFAAGGAKFATDGDVELSWSALNTTKAPSKLVLVNVRAAKDVASAAKFSVTITPNSGSFKIVVNGSDITVA